MNKCGLCLTSGVSNLEFDLKVIHWSESESHIFCALVTLVSLLLLGICGKITVIKDFIRGWPVIDGDGYRLNVGNCNL